MQPYGHLPRCPLQPACATCLVVLPPPARSVTPLARHVGTLPLQTIPVVRSERAGRWC